jgi:hypothetical protein
LHEYYTPKTSEFQAVLSIFTIFVDYADIYVNMVMSTTATMHYIRFTIFDDFSRCRGAFERAALNVVYAGILACRQE